MKDDDLIITEGVLDLGAVGAAQETVTYSSGIDAITISGLDYSSMASTITLPAATYSVGAGINYTSTNGYNWSGTSPSTVSISTDGIDMAAGTDLKIDGKSLKEFMNKMEQRLAILVPDPAKLEKFQALKKAYEHYKTMESLCFDEPEEDKE